MRFSVRSKLSILFSLLTIAAVVGGFAVSGALQGVRTAQATAAHVHIDCSSTVQSPLCTDVANSDEVFGHYVGHDEPSNLFYSNVAGSGNKNSWKLTSPRTPRRRTR